MKRKIEPKKHTLTGKNPPKAIKTIDPGWWKIYVVLFLIILITFIAYLPVFHNGLLNWDDANYILNNRQLPAHSFNLIGIFSDFVLGNYHPLTMLVYTIEYHFFGINPAGYHAVNLFLHLVNVILVFYAVYLISDKFSVALIASFLFGIHPLHVESVAWAAELKDLLYTLFFLASYIFYLKYLKERITNYELRITNRRSAQTNYESAHQHIGTSAHYYILALALFVFSLLSKAMAASLPLVMLLTDYFKGRKIDKKVLLEKAPFFLLAIIFGVVAVIAQKSSNAIQDITVYAFPQRLVFAAFGFVSYLIKLALPVNLSAFYPYPVSSGIPLHYYAFVLIFIILAAYIIYSVKFTKKIIFGMGFFTITILLVLQILPVGKTIMADRYSYIPSIGIFYLAGEGLSSMFNPAFAGQVGQYSMFNKIKWSRTFGIAVLSIAGVLFSVKTYARCRIWKNDGIFWNDVIDKYQTVEDAYLGSGIFYMNERRDDKAISAFNKAIELNPGNAEAYYNLGLFYMNDTNPKSSGEAIKSFSKAIELNPGYANAYNNRGIVFVSENRNTEAIDDFSKAIELRPDFTDAYTNRGIVFCNEKRYDEAIKDYNKVINFNSGDAEVYVTRGFIFMNAGKNNEALNDFNRAIELKPDYAPAWYNRGILEFREDNKSASCADLKKAASLGYKPAEAALAQICK